MNHPIEDKNIVSRLSWHGKDGHSTLIKIDWPIENSSISNLTTSTLNSSPITPVTPVYDPLETDSEVSESNKHTIKIESNDCLNCSEDKCLKCELKAADYERINVEDPSPIHSDISYQNLNRLSAVSTSSSDHNSDKKHDLKIMTSSHESSSSYSNVSLKHDEPYECYNFTRPNYINLQSSSSKSSPGSPLKSPLKSTISITFRSPTKSKDCDRDSVYEDIDLEKNLSIVEEASVPQTDASLPTQEACQPDEDLIILETPTQETNLDDDNIDVYSQVKFFKKSIEEVNAMILESPEKEDTRDVLIPQKSEDRHYENISFDRLNDVQNDYENINVDTLKICDHIDAKDILNGKDSEKDNGNTIKTVEAMNLNVRELAIRFESPTEQKGPFTFEKFKAEIKYPSLDKNNKVRNDQVTVEIKKDPSEIKIPNSPKSYKLSKNSARSLDENAFVKEFGNEKDRRKSLEVRDGKRPTKYMPDLNLNLNPIENESKPIITTPTTENKISLIQRFNEKRPTDIRQLINFDTEKKLSRERIEKYKEERRNFLREKYSSQSFRSNPEQLTRIKIKKDEKVEEDVPKIFERRNTVDLGQRMRFSLAKSVNNLDIIQSPSSPEEEDVSRRLVTRKEDRESIRSREFER